MFTLTIEDSNGQIADRFTFDHGAYVIGRQENCDIVLPSPSVSRQHARIFIDNGRCYVEDLGSANGVVVDGQRVIQQRDLGTASQIKVGDFYLYLEYKRPDRAAQHNNVMSTLFISDDAGHFKLVRINDSFAGEEFGLSEVENTIGRTDENFILLSDTSISRQHARIVRDGEIYTLMDLGSSNGSRVNGKDVATPTTLKPGDRVQFGNIEFVFAEGNANINPADYAKASGGNAIIYAGLAAFLLLGLAGGALIVYGYLTLRDDGGSTNGEIVNNIDAQVERLVEEGKAQMERKEWEAAAGTFEEILALKPDHVQAKELRATAQIEAEAKSKYERGEILVEGGRHRDARDVLKEISEDTAVYDKAQKTLAQIDKTLAHNLRNEAARLAKSKSKTDLLDAHEKLKESLKLVPEDEETKALLDDLEQKMKKRKIKF